MIDLNLIAQIQQASVADRIQLIEIILESLKSDVTPEQSEQAPPFQPFKVQTFDLGEDVSPDRDVIYADRGWR